MFLQLHLSIFFLCFQHFYNLSALFIATHLTFLDILARNQKYLKNAAAELLAKVMKALICSGYEDAGRAANFFYQILKDCQDNYMLLKGAFVEVLIIPLR